jgi:hypothetical protein
MGYLAVLFCVLCSGLCVLMGKPESRFSKGSWTPACPGVAV